MKRVKISLKGEALLDNPLFNKGTAFTNSERDAFELHGLLPYHVATIEQQSKRRYDNFSKQPTDLAKYVFLSALQNRNEILYYRLVMDHVEEMMPLIYTPTVGEASVFYSSIYTQARGIFISYPHKDKMEEMVSHIPLDDIQVIVVTDGERILGLGDLGANGMAISIGKIALYTLFGGIYPGNTLPVVLDVGTNNQKLLSDPNYLGWRSPRITGKEYDDFVDDFVQAIKKRYPKVLLQWEDFAKPHARPLLDRYRDEICSFNDDIQGTASVVLTAILSGIKMKGERLSQQRIAVLGAGSAGIGICQHILYAMQQEGMSKEEALKCFYLVDIQGLLHSGLENLDQEQKPFAHWKIEGSPHFTLLDVVNNSHPTILIGVSAQTGAFTEEIIKNMAKHVDRPIICPLSNPTEKSEARPEDLIRWTQGKAIIATGSPFPAVKYEGKTFPISQCNNVYIFPGVGLGIIASQSRKVTDAMFLQAALTLKEYSPALKDPLEPLFPDLKNLRKISQEIALAVGLQAQEEGVAPKTSKEELKKKIGELVWFPEYPQYY